MKITKIKHVKREFFKEIGRCSEHAGGVTTARKEIIRRKRIRLKKNRFGSSLNRFTGEPNRLKRV